VERNLKRESIEGDVEPNLKSDSSEWDVETVCLFVVPFFH
jgi:hypothetical protein